jgi:hypothetical protein
MSLDDLLERLAELEHGQWAAWTREVSGEVAPDRRRRWEAFFCPYAELPEGAKEQDRLWARRVLDLLREQGVLGSGGRVPGGASS